METGATNDRQDKRLMIEVFWVGDIFGENRGNRIQGARSANAITDGRVLTDYEFLLARSSPR